MKKRINKEDFSSFIENMHSGKDYRVYSNNEGTENISVFRKFYFQGESIILYSSGDIRYIPESGCGLLSYDDFVQGAWDIISNDDEYEVFIENNLTI